MGPTPAQSTSSILSRIRRSSVSGVGNAQQRLGEAHEHHALVRAEAVGVHEASTPPWPVSARRRWARRLAWPRPARPSRGRAAARPAAPRPPPSRPPGRWRRCGGAGRGGGAAGRRGGRTAWLGVRRWPDSRVWYGRSPMQGAASAQSQPDSAVLSRSPQAVRRKESRGRHADSAPAAHAAARLCRARTAAGGSRIISTRRWTPRATGSRPSSRPRLRGGQEPRLHLRERPGQPGDGGADRAEARGRRPDVIVPISTPSAQAVVGATKDIPVVFTAVTDPVGRSWCRTRRTPAAT